MRVFFLIGVLFVSINLWAAPAGFEDLTELKSADIILTVNDGDALSLPGKISPQTVYFNSTTQEKLHTFLLEQYLKPEVAEKLTTLLLNGATTSVLCKGRRDSCLIDESVVSEPQIVIVSDSSKVRLLIPSALMAEHIQQTHFIDNTISSNAIIMHHNFNIGAGSDTDTYGYYRNSLTASLGSGFFRGDINLTSNKDNTKNDSYLYADEITWNYLTKNWRTQIGYVSDYNNKSWNATTLLDTDEHISSVRVSLGTTSELEFKNKATAERLYFSIPSSGRLKITREDGTPVLEHNVSAGQNYISYNDLPQGITTLIITVESGGQEIFRDVRKIYNTADINLTSGGFDFLFSAGMFQQQNIYPDWVDYNKSWNNEGYFQTQMVGSINEPWLLGASVLNTKDTYYAKLATQFKPVSWFSMNAIIGQFDSGSSYNQASGNLGRLSWDISRYQDKTIVNTNKFTLEHYLYGLGDYHKWSLGLNQHLWKGNAYIYYSNYRQELDTSAYISDEQNFQDNSSLTVGYSWQGPWRSTIDSNVMKTFFDDTNGSQIDEWQLSLNISIPLSSGGDDYVNYHLSSQYSENSDYQYHSATYGHRFNMEQGTDLNMEIRGSGYTGKNQNFSDTMIGDVTFSSGYQSDQWNGNAMVYANTSSEYDGYADMQTTTVLSGGGWYQTHKQADSYLLVTNTGDQGLSLNDDGDKVLTTVQLKENKESAGRLVVDKAKIVYPLNVYKEYQAKVDDSSSDYYNKGERFVQGSSLPGTALQLNVDNREVRSYISVFSNIEGEPIDDVACIGDGCVSVEMLTEGVFKFRVSKGLSFKLKTSLNQHCFIPSPNSRVHQNLGKNFCMPQFDNVNGLQISKGDNEQYYYYVGEFATLDKLASYVKALNEENSNIKLIKKYIGERIFLFVRTPQYLTQKEVSLVDTLSTYALEEKSSSSYVYH